MGDEDLSRNIPAINRDLNRTELLHPKSQELKMDIKGVNQLSLRNIFANCNFTEHTANIKT